VLEGTLREVARARKLPLTDARITARIKLNISDDRRYVLDAELPKAHPMQSNATL
jgi:hypothetical protein